MRIGLLLFVLSVNHIATAQQLFQRAEDAYVSSDFRSARKLVSQKIASKPEAEDFLLRALVHQELRMYGNAYDDYLASIEQNEEYYEAYFLFAKFLTDTHEYEKAISTLDLLLDKLNSAETQGIIFKMDRHGDENIKVESLANMEAEILISRAIAYQAINQYDEALRDFNSAILKNPSPDKFVNRANLYVKMGQLDSAKVNLKKAIQIQPNYGLAWYNLFVLDQKTKLPTGLKNNKEFGALLEIRAVEASNVGNYNLAQKLFEQAIRLNPNNPTLLLNAGRLDFTTRFYRGALDKFTQALKLDSNEHKALYLIGNVHFGRKDFSRAIDYYQQYLKTDPEYADVWFNAGMTYLELGNKNAACKCLERAHMIGMKQSESYMEKYCTKG